MYVIQLTVHADCPRITVREFHYMNFEHMQATSSNCLMRGLLEQSVYVDTILILTALILF